MSDQEADDITALCSSAQLMNTAYKKFPRLFRTSAPTFAGAGNSADPASRRPLQPTRCSETVVADIPAEALHRSQSTAGEPRWQALDRLFSDSAAAAVRTDATVDPVAIRGAAGGTGASTVAATLSRVLMLNGQRVLLADSSPEPWLAGFFGASGVGRGLHSILETRFGRTERLQVLTRPMQPEAGGLDWLRAGIARAGSSYDWLLVDSGNGPWSREDLWLTEIETQVFVLVPDVRCAAAVTRIEGQSVDREQRAGPQLRPVYLLNQFRPDLPLHVEIRARLTEVLGERLLGVAEWSEKVSEAVAQGQTIVDYAPDAAVTHDFYRLARALASQLNCPGMPLEAARAAS